MKLEFKLEWVNEEGEEFPDFTINTTTLTYEWRKRQQLVDFATAFAAFEKGAKITSEVTGDTGSLKVTHRTLFREDEIRGKWIIEGGAI